MFGFISEEIVPALENLFTPFNLICDALAILLGIMSLRRKWDLMIVASFVVLSFVSTCIVNGLGFVNWGNGSRVFIGTLFICPYFRYVWDDDNRHKFFIEKIDKHLIVWLVIQAFCVVEQFIRYGAGDHVGGSMGNGFSPVVSFGIYMISFYLLRKRLDPDNVFQSIRDNYWLVLLLFPTFLNETKISFILILMYFFLLFPINKSYIKRVLLIAPAVALLMGGALWVYIETVGRSDDMLDPKFLIEEYLYSDLGPDELADGVDYAFEYEIDLPDVPRFAKMAMIPYIFSQEGNQWLMGYGVGCFNGTFFVEPPKIAKNYEWFFIGTNPYLNHILLQLGILGIIWAVAFFWGVFKIKPFGNYKQNKNTVIFAVANIVICIFYADLMRTMSFSILYIFFCFTAWDKIKVSSGKSPIENQQTQLL